MMLLIRHFTLVPPRAKVGQRYQSSCLGFSVSTPIGIPRIMVTLEYRLVTRVSCRSIFVTPIAPEYFTSGYIVAAQELTVR